MILLLLLSSIGLVWIIKDSHILKKPRSYIQSKSKLLKELLSCSQCLGFWVGLLYSIFEYKTLGWNINVFLYPLCCSAFCWFTDSLLDLIQEASASFEVKRKNKQ